MLARGVQLGADALGFEPGERPLVVVEALRGDSRHGFRHDDRLAMRIEGPGSTVAGMPVVVEEPAQRLPLSGYWLVFRGEFGAIGTQA